MLDHAINATTTETFKLGVDAIVFKSLISYSEGTNTKDDIDGNTYPNTIGAGADESPSLNYLGYLPVFYGPTATKNITSANVRTNLTKRLENTGNVFNLATGNTHKIFQLWLPPGTNLVSVIDLDALNANITGSYASEALIVNDISGDPIAVGTLYTLTADVPYNDSHRHQITIS